MNAATQLLKMALRKAQFADLSGLYDDRAVAISEVIGYCEPAGIAWGIRIDTSEPQWPVVYFELPTGQVSYHMPQHPISWDGHTTDEKNSRINAYLRGMPGLSSVLPDEEAT